MHETMDVATLGDSLSRRRAASTSSAAEEAEVSDNDGLAQSGHRDL